MMRAKIISKIENITDSVMDFWEEFKKEFDSDLKAKLFLIGLLLIYISAIGITANEIKKVIS